MGAALSLRLVSNLKAAGLGNELVDALLEPASGAVIDAGARAALADAIHLVFTVAFVAAVLGLLSAFFAPHRDLKDRERENEPVMISAE
jgi:hypothetical protein